MNKNALCLFFLLSPLPGIADNIVDPVSFEQIWLQNNQRNIFRRYHYYNEQVQRENMNLYLIGVDAAPDRTISTSEGDREALISRLNIHYQSPQYLFLIDWLSAIPQPQTTEGFTYGDLIAARTWQFENDNAYLTFGVRQVSTPRSIVVDSERVFNAVDDATEETYSIFIHYNYHGYNLGTYYTEDRQIDALDFHIPLLMSDTQTISSTVYYYEARNEANLSERYEISLDYAALIGVHDIRSGIVATYLEDSDTFYVSNIFIHYTFPVSASFNVITGAYYSDIENEQTLPGGKLGLTWKPDDIDDIQLSFSIQKNAIGDFNALIIRDEPVFSFTLSSIID